MMISVMRFDTGPSLAVWILALLLSAGAVWVMRADPFGRYFVRIAAPAMVAALAASAFVTILRWHLIWFTPLTLFVAYAFAFRRLFTLAFRASQLAKALGGTDQEAQEALNRVIEGRDGTERASDASRGQPDSLPPR
jgi:hypothetical protein